MSGEDTKTESACAQLAATMPVVLSQYELLRCVFGHLPMSSLCAVAPVCKLWNDVAQTTKRLGSRRCRVAARCWIGKKLALSEYSKYPRFQSPNHMQLESFLAGEIAETVDILPEVAVVLHTVNGSSGGGPSFVLDMPRIERLLPKGCHTISMATDGAVGFDAAGNSTEIENVRGMMTPMVSVMLFPKMPEAKVIPFKVGYELG